MYNLHENIILKGHRNIVFKVTEFFLWETSGTRCVNVKPGMIILVFIPVLGHSKSLLPEGIGLDFVGLCNSAVVDGLTDQEEGCG
jgi:hypothetical protein